MKSTVSSAMMAAMCTLVAGCGGGGGSSGGVGSTPTPPIAPTNTSLTNLVASESFANDAASTTVAWDLVTKTGISGTAKRADTTIRYDHAAKTYTVSYDGRSQTFGQGDIQQNTPGDTIYKKTDAPTSDYLTLVKIPYSDSRPTQYVGLGTWQRNVISGSTQNTEYAAFTYGLPTAAGAVPRTGDAGFRVDAFGLVSAPGQEPRSFQGQGQFSVDFGAGVFSTQTYLTEYQLVSDDGTFGGGIELQATGRLASSGGGFSGTALYGGWFGNAAGSLAGRFYGPAAEELGASFHATNAAGMSVAGGFTGQRDTAITPENLTLTNLRRQQLFYTQFGYNLVGQLNWENAETFTFSPPTSDLNGGRFTINDKVAGGDPNFNTWRKTFGGTFGGQDVTLSLYKPGSQNTELALTYASFGKWLMVPQSGPSSPFPIELYFAYGLETPARLLSGKTGTANYAGIVQGWGQVTSPSSAYYSVKGTSAFQVNFGTQSYSGTLAMNGQPSGGGSGSGVDFGSFAFAGPLAAYTAGTAVPLTRGGTAVGQLETRFFGPDGEEIAGPFSLRVPAGMGANTVISGVAIAKRQ